MKQYIPLFESFLHEQKEEFDTYDSNSYTMFQNQEEFEPRDEENLRKTSSLSQKSDIDATITKTELNEDPQPTISIFSKEPVEFVLCGLSCVSTRESLIKSRTVDIDTSNENIIMYDPEATIVSIDNHLAFQFKDSNTGQIQTLYVKDIVKKDKNHAPGPTSTFLLGPIVRPVWYIKSPASGKFSPVATICNVEISRDGTTMRGPLGEIKRRMRAFLQNGEIYGLGYKKIN